GQVGGAPRQHPGDRTQGGRLPGPVPAGQPHHLPRVDVEVDRGQDDGAAVGGVQPADPEAAHLAATSDEPKKAVTTSGSTVTVCGAPWAMTLPKSRTVIASDMSCTKPTLWATTTTVSPSRSRSRLSSDASCRISRSPRPSITFSRTVRSGTSDGLWKVRDTPLPRTVWAGLWLTSRPSTRIRPAVTRWSPVTQLRKVVLPAPLGPTRAWMVPSRTERL